MVVYKYIYFKNIFKKFLNIKFIDAHQRNFIYFGKQLSTKQWGQADQNFS